MNLSDKDTLTLALKNRRSVRDFSGSAISFEQLDSLIWAAQGITGENGLRTVPSAHGLHPLCLTVVAGNIEDVQSGVYDVARQTNELALRGADDIRENLKAAAVDDQTWIAEAPLIITVCADFVEPSRAFADQKPFGRRGPTYVTIEAGAAAQNMMLMATKLGLGSVLVAGIDDNMTGSILALDAPFSPVLHVCFGVPKD